MAGNFFPWKAASAVALATEDETVVGRSAFMAGRREGVRNTATMTPSTASVRARTRANGSSTRPRMA